MTSRLIDRPPGLSDKEIVEICSRKGQPLRALAVKYNLAEETISKLRRGLMMEVDYKGLGIELFKPRSPGRVIYPVTIEGTTYYWGRVTKDTIQKIFDLRNEGVVRSEIAQRTETSDTTVGVILRGEIPHFPYGELIGDITFDKRNRSLKRLSFELEGAIDRMAARGYTRKQTAVELGLDYQTFSNIRRLIKKRKENSNDPPLDEDKEMPIEARIPDDLALFTPEYIRDVVVLKKEGSSMGEIATTLDVPVVEVEKILFHTGQL